ncbi:unnamed protein product, partial [marine sediment metagenome]
MPIKRLGVGSLGLRLPAPFLEGIDMSKEMESLAKIGEPDQVEIVPG